MKEAKEKSNLRYELFVNTIITIGQYHKYHYYLLPLRYCCVVCKR